MGGNKDKNKKEAKKQPKNMPMSKGQKMAAAKGKGKC